MAVSKAGTVGRAAEFSRAGSARAQAGVAIQRRSTEARRSAGNGFRERAKENFRVRRVKSGFPASPLLCQDLAGWLPTPWRTKPRAKGRRARTVANDEFEKTSGACEKARKWDAVESVLARCRQSAPTGVHGCDGKNSNEPLNTKRLTPDHQPQPPTNTYAPHPTHH